MPVLLQVWSEFLCVFVLSLTGSAEGDYRGQSLLDIDHSQANLLSKLDRPMAKACRAHIG